VEEAVAITAEEIAGSEPGIALLERVAHELSLGCATIVGVAVVMHHAAGSAEQLARLVGRALDEEAIGSAHRRVVLHVIARELYLGMLKRIRAADGAGTAAAVHQAHVAFGRAVHFENLRDAEALLERLPDVRPKPRPRRIAERMLAVRRGGRLLQQISAELADVDEASRAVAADVRQKFSRAELA